MTAAVPAEAVDPALVDPALVDRIRATLVSEDSEATPARVAAALRGERRLLGQTEALSVVTVLRSELAGTGVLEPLLRLPGITDVLVNGADEVWVDTGDGLTRSRVRFAGEAEVRRLAVRLATAAGRRLDESKL